MTSTREKHSPTTNVLVWVLCPAGNPLAELVASWFTIRVFNHPELLVRELKRRPGDARLPAILVAKTQTPEKFCASLQELPAPLPRLIIISRRNEAEIIEMSLDQGAEDYLVAPVDEQLLHVKLRRLLRAQSSELNEPLQELGLRADPLRLAIMNGAGNEVNLTPKEFQLFHRLCQDKHTGALRTELQHAIWPNVRVVPKALDTHLFKLRRKLALLGFDIVFDQRSRYSLKLAAPSAKKTALRRTINPP